MGKINSVGPVLKLSPSSSRSSLQGNKYFVTVIVAGTGTSFKSYPSFFKTKKAALKYRKRALNAKRRNIRTFA